MSQDPLVVGRTYRFSHSRKGTFTAKVLKVLLGDGFVEVRLTEGRAKMAPRDAVAGEAIEVRLSLMSWTPV